MRPDRLGLRVLEARHLAAFARMPRREHRLAFERHRVGDQPPAGLQGRPACLDQSGRARPAADEDRVWGVEAAQWQSIVVPAGTPRPIVNRLHDELLKIMRQPAVIERLAGFGLDNATSASPEDLGRMMREEVARWPAIYKSLGVEPE
jgi:hypothetical protein